MALLSQILKKTLEEVRVISMFPLCCIYASGKGYPWEGAEEEEGVFMYFVFICILYHIIYIILYFVFMHLEKDILEEGAEEKEGVFM